MAVRPAVADSLLADAASLRRLARSLLAADDAEDAVQDACVAALEQRALLLRPGLWLRGTVRKLAMMARRGDARRSARERRAARPEADPHDPAALAAQAELVRDIGAAVHALDEPFRSAILLRFWHDLSVDAIAARLRVPRNTVRSQLQRGLARLRERLDRVHGHRDRWAVALGAFAPMRSFATFTVCLMNKKLLLGAAVLLLAASAAPLLLHEPTGRAMGGVSPEPGRVTAAIPTAANAAEQAAPQREAVPAVRADGVSTGSLIVRVEYRDEPKAAAGMPVLVGRTKGDFRVGLRAVTDATGTARFDGIAPGKVWVRCHARFGATAEVCAGATAECVVQLSGSTLNGIVVDATGAGIGGAIVEMGYEAHTGDDADVAAVTAADGRFVLRHVNGSMVGARATGYAASRLYPTNLDLQAGTMLRIELVAAGGGVAGIVLGPDGRPVRGAVVRVGEGRLDALLATVQGAPPLPAQVRTDADGRFNAIGLPVGACPVQVRASGLGPWAGTCEVAAGRTASVDVRLDAGVTCSGTLRTEAGEPVDRARVRSGRDGDFLQYFARTAADGSFTLEGLPTTECEVWAAESEHGKASARVRGAAGSTVRCELVLKKEPGLHGQVVDEHGKAVVMAEIVCEAEGRPFWSKLEVSDQDGRFAVPDCPDGRLLLVKATARQRVPFQQQGVDPRAAELRVQLPLDTSPRAHITGRIVGPEGKRAAGAQVDAMGPPRSSQRELLDVKSEDGSFTVEVTAGWWQVRIYGTNLPTVFAGKRELEAGGAWDLGTIELVRGGTLVVRDGGREGRIYNVYDVREQFRCALYVPGPSRRSELLAPGEHLLTVSGADTAAHVLPFMIRAGEETVLEVKPVAGVRQRFEFVPAPAAKLPPWITFAVRRDGKLVGYCSNKDRDPPLFGEVRLVPGEYVLTAVTEKVEGTASFTVGSEEGPPVRVTVR
jgi:RNA polymerase sigma-70 factor (ECF subfamily)